MSANDLQAFSLFCWLSFILGMTITILTYIYHKRKQDRYR